MKAKSNVESFDSKLPFKFCRPRVPERVPEGVKFFTGAALTFWVPTLFYCAASHQALPFYLMVCNHALGVLIGVWLYEKKPGDFLSCVPISRVPATPSSAVNRERKKAA